MTIAMNRHLNITGLFTELKKSTDEHTALTISEAFEQVYVDQDAKINSAIQNLVTNEKLEKELALLRLDVHKEISGAVFGAKWQVIGVMLLLFFTDVIAKHFGW